MNIVIDCIFFQFNEWSGIAKYWKILFQRLDDYLDNNSSSSFQIYLLVRGRSAPLRQQHFRTLKKLYVAYFDYRSALSDYVYLGKLCQDLNASVFISTYYTLAYGVPNLGMTYDLIPEYQNLMLSHEMWANKALYMMSLSHTLCISQTTADDVRKFYPNISCSEKDVFYPLFKSSEFEASTPSEVNEFRSRYDITYPYIAVVGNRSGYKNVDLILRALATRELDARKLGVGIIASSGEPLDAAQVNLYSNYLEFGIRQLFLSDSEIPIFLHAAELLFYPSLLEGFGYPVVEALAQGTPVLTTGSTSLQEILHKAKASEYCITNGYDSTHCLSTLVSMLHTRPHVSNETKQQMKTTFCTDYSEKILCRISELGSECCTPTESYLSACLPLDGLLA